jgi:hypothetical protein
MTINLLTGRILKAVTALSLLLSMVFLDLVFSRPALAQGRETAIASIATPPVEHSVQFYKAANYSQGTCFGDNAGDYPTLCDGFDESISSLVLKSGWSVRVYQDIYMDGTSRCFTASDEDLANNTFEDGTPLNDQISSFRLYHQSSCPGLIQPPAAPALFSPLNGSSHSYDHDLTFQWIFSSGATEYLVEWWGGPYGPMQPCGWTASASCHVGTVTPGYTYSWHVKARNSAGESGWSSTWTFTIRQAPPAGFSKLSPLNGATGQSTSPTLAWEASSGASSYEYCYDTTNDNACSPWVNNGTSTSKVLSGLAPNTIHYWHVRAVNSGGTTYSNGSPVAWAFTTGTLVDIYEPDNSSAQAKVIDPGIPQTHSILPASDVDWVKFTLGAASAVVLETTGTAGADTEMWLYNSSLAQLKYSNDEGAGSYSSISTTCGVDALPAGTYYVKIGEQGNNNEIASYLISLQTVGCPPAPIFQDVPSTHWARDFIERLYDAGITGGCTATPLNYCPEATVTRAQMAVFLLRGIHGAAYNPPALGSSTGFGDVSTSYWAAGWIKQLAAEGITGGCGSGNYCPEAPVTRAEMAIFLLRSRHGSNYIPPVVGTSTGFSDVSTSYWAAAWIKQLVAEGITSGCGAGTYCPEAPVTRAQMAVFLVRAFELP